MPQQKISLTEKFAKFNEHWSPKILTELHGVALKAVKLKGEFIWHHHEKEDEIFWVTKGRLIMHFRDGDVEVFAGELIHIPHGVEHMPEAPEEVEIVLIEPTETLNTGSAEPNTKTVKQLDKI